MGNEVTKYDKAWADDAKAKAAKEQVASQTISHRGGVFKCGDMEFPELCVIILADIYENSYYPGSFDADVMVPPTCYALSEEDDGMSPHPAMQNHEYFEPQDSECSSCPFNQWGSADTGKGKACKNTRRMSVIPAGVYSKRKGSRDLDLDLYITEDTDENVEHIAHSEAMMIKVPPTSVREYQRYVQELSSEYSRPPRGVLTRIYTEPMDNGGHKLVFEAVEPLPDDLYPAVTARAAAVVADLFVTYDGPDEKDGGPRDHDSASSQDKGRNRLKGFKKRNK